MLFPPSRYKNLNIDLAQQVLDHITAYPEEHGQQGWGSRPGYLCGTSACIAGWVCIYGTPGLLEKESFTVIEEFDRPAFRAAQLLGVVNDYHWILANIFGEFDEEAALVRFKTLIEAAKRIQRYDLRQTKKWLAAEKEYLSEVEKSGRAQAVISARDLANMKAMNK